MVMNTGKRLGPMIGEKEIFEIDVELCQNGIVCPCANVQLPVVYKDKDNQNNLLDPM